MIGLKNGDRIVRPEVYIDTGAQFCLFNNEYAKAVGINNFKDTKYSIPLAGIGGAIPQNAAYFHDIELLIFKNWKDFSPKNAIAYKTKVGFLENPISYGGVLGVYGFLNKFQFSFNLSQSYFEITPLD